MENDKYISVVRLAVVLGLPRTWLSIEAKTGRIPCLQAGRRMLFSVGAVREALANRESKGVARG